MKVEHEAELARNETSMLRWMCGFDLRNNKYNTEVKELLDWNQSVCHLRAADCGGLDVLNIKMMQIGSSDVCRWRLRKPNRGDIKQRLHVIVSQGIWRLMAVQHKSCAICKACCTDSKEIDGSSA